MNFGNVHQDSFGYGCARSEGDSPPRLSFGTPPPSHMSGPPDYFSALAQASGRPGLQPRTMDFMLSQEELSRRNARRKRNREAAARCRERRMETIKELEDKVKALQNERDELKNQKDVMAYELDKCRFQLKMMSTNNGNENGTDSPQSTKSLHSPMTPKEPFQYESFSDPGLTPLLDGRVKFEFPDLPEESTRKARMASTSEFNKFLDEF